MSNPVHLQVAFVASLMALEQFESTMPFLRTLLCWLGPTARSLLAASGVTSSNTSSADEGIFHSSSQNSASSGETSTSIRAETDSRNFSLDAEAPIPC